MDDTENLIETFKSLTGSADDQQAAAWLEMANFDMDTAIQLYFDGSEKVIASKSDQKRSVTSSEPHRSKRSYEAYDMDDVRAPDEVKRSKLYENIYGEEIRGAIPMISAFKSARTTSQGNSSRDNTLATMFQAPIDLMTQGCFDDVRELALRENRWLLVNIQRESEFQSHVLNRDFWNDETAKNIIACSFVFWQQQDVSRDGELFISRYKISIFPSVSIIDPITGALIWRMEGSKATPLKLGETLQDFIDKKSCPESAPRGVVSKDAVSGHPEQARHASVSSSTFSSVIDLSATSVGATNEQTKLENSNSTSTVDSNRAAKNVVDTVKSSCTSASGGFSVEQIQGLFDAEASSHDVPKDSKFISLKIKTPSNKQIVVQVQVGERVLTVLRRIVSELITEGRFEVSFGLPSRNLSEQEGVLTKTLDDVSINQNMLLHVRPV